jgi:DNA-binding CsgD family transcriptional regulator
MLQEQAMGTELRNVTRRDMNLLFQVVNKLYSSHDRDLLRMGIAEDLLRLLHADFLASFIWNPDNRVFEHVVFLNMATENIERYHTYYQYCDPITSSLQQRRQATMVYEVMPQQELERTEFFNDFLMQDGLHHGINLYAYDGDLNIGDLRIWRAKHGPDFGAREVSLLDYLLPHFTNALRNVRAIETARGIAGFWAQLLENTHIALFLFDENGTLIHRNSKAHDIEKKLSQGAYGKFYDHLTSLATSDISETRWGLFTFSILPLLSPQTSRPVTAILAHGPSAPRIDRDFLRTAYALSGREAEICFLVIKGLTDHEIASALEISFHTVRTHLKHVFEKLDATTRSELVYYLLDGIVDITF